MLNPQPHLPWQKRGCGGRTWQGAISARPKLALCGKRRVFGGPVWFCFACAFCLFPTVLDRRARAAPALAGDLARGPLFAREGPIRRQPQAHRLRGGRAGGGVRRGLHPAVLRGRARFAAWRGAVGTRCEPRRRGQVVSFVLGGGVKGGSAVRAARRGARVLRRAVCGVRPRSASPRSARPAPPDAAKHLPRVSRRRGVVHPPAPLPQLVYAFNPTSKACPQANTFGG